LNLVDSSAWIAYFRGEKNAGKFAKVVEDLEHLVVASIELIEVFKFIHRHGNEHSALEAIAHMQRGQVVPLSGELALEAAEIGLELQLPLADSVIYATARRLDAVLWTQDSDFRDLPGVRYFA
jgi:predicted nucleic acid-binding protein